jgi:hypothetical protein
MNILGGKGNHVPAVGALTQAAGIYQAVPLPAAVWSDVFVNSPSLGILGPR